MYTHASKLDSYLIGLYAAIDGFLDFWDADTHHEMTVARKAFGTRIVCIR